MKRYLIKIYLVVCTAAAIVLYILVMSKPNPEIVEPLNNDSILVSEYQAALDSFMKVNPKAAHQFMDLVEKVNINEQEK